MRAAGAVAWNARASTKAGVRRGFQHRPGSRQFRDPPRMSAARPAPGHHDDCDRRARRRPDRTRGSPRRQSDRAIPRRSVEESNHAAHPDAGTRAVAGVGDVGAGARVRAIEAATLPRRVIAGASRGSCHPARTLTCRSRFRYRSLAGVMSRGALPAIKWTPYRRSVGKAPSVGRLHAGQLAGGDGAVAPYAMLNPSVSLSGLESVDTWMPFWIITPPSLAVSPGLIPLTRVPGSNVVWP